MKNVATNTHNETIGDFVKKHTGDGKTKVLLRKYVDDYLNEEDCILFDKLTLSCVDGCLSAYTDEGDVFVTDSNGYLFTYFDYDYPVVDVFKDLLYKMSKDVELCIMYLRNQYIESFELRIWSDDIANYNALKEFATDYGLDIKQSKKNNIPYIDIIGIKPLPITTN